MTIGIAVFHWPRARSPRNAQLNQDMISDLPEAVIHEILSRLPVRDAAMTSVLSRKWRYRWASLPHLVLNQETLGSYIYYPNNVSAIDPHLVTTVDHILMLHLGHIEKFNVCLPVPNSAIDRWILRLSKTSVKDFALTALDPNRYIVPTCFYSCQWLTKLELSNLSLRPLPSSFKVFKYLKRIKFHDVSMAQDALEKLISSCPVLERLRIAEVPHPTNGSNSFSDLKICAPNLRRFIGIFHHGVTFENTFCLAEIKMLCAGRVSDRKSRANPSNFQKFFHHLPRVQKLCLGTGFLEHLSVALEPSKLPEPCSDLDCLAIQMLFCSEKTSLSFLSILNIAPNLRTLKVSMIPPRPSDVVGPPSEFWANCRCDRPFSKLETVHISAVSGSKPEMEFIKFLLNNSPALERLFFTVFEFSDRLDLIAGQVLSLRRFSGGPEIIYSRDFGFFE